jgi:putative DNA primase/helicase
VWVPFNATFKGADRDPQMLEKLKSEAPAILNWIVRGAMAWASEGLAIPGSVDDASADYMAEHDDLALWMDECCIRSGEGKANELYRSFAKWKEARRESAPSMTSWGSRIGALPGITKRRSNGARYVGVRLKELEAQPLCQ